MSFKTTGFPMYIVSSYDRDNSFAPFLWDYKLTRTELQLLITASKYSYMILRRLLGDPAVSVSIESATESALDFNCLYGQFVRKRCNVIFRFSKDVAKKRTTITGDSPSFATVMTYKNAPMKNISVKNLIARYSISRFRY